MIGVYCLKHQGKIVYIGSSAVNMMQRKSYHLREIKNKTHKNKYLRDLDNVQFEILEFTSLSECRLIESRYLKKYKPIANKQTNAKGHLKLKGDKHKTAALNRWKKKSERVKASLSAKNRWKNAEPDQINKNLNMLKINRAKSKPKIIEHCKTTLAEMKKKKVIRSDGIIFESINTAAEKTGIGRTNLSNCLNGWSKTAGGFQWQYYKD